MDLGRADPFRSKNLIYFLCQRVICGTHSCTQTLERRGQCPHTGDFARQRIAKKKLGVAPPPLIISVGYNLQKFLLQSKKRYTAYPRPDYLSQFCAFENHLNGDHLSEGGRLSELGQQFPGRINLRTQSGHCKLYFRILSLVRRYILLLSLLPTPIIFLSSTCFVERG